MFLFLLVLGAVITAFGLGLAGWGISVQEHTFDATKVTPGVTAVIGGCIVIGLAFVVRALLRVERALTTRQVAQPARAAEASAAADQTEPGRMPFPPKPNAVPRAPPAPAAMAALLASSGAPAAAGPPADRTENAPIVEESDASLLPKAPVQAGEESKASFFDAPWHKPQRPTPGAEAVPAPTAAPGPAEPAAPAVDAVTPQGPSEAAASWILKSGVVEGIAYTIYSDGSIEARLPDGTLRFGSIAELRTHIEQKR